LACTSRGSDGSTQSTLCWRPQRRKRAAEKFPVPVSRCVGVCVLSGPTSLQSVPIDTGLSHLHRGRRRGWSPRVSAAPVWLLWVIMVYWEDSCRYPRVAAAGAAAAAARINQSTHPHSIPMHSNTTRSMPRRIIDPQIHLRLLDGRATAGTPSRPRKTRPADTRPPPRRSAYPEPPSFFPRPSKAADRSPRSSAPISGQGGGGGS